MRIRELKDGEELALRAVFHSAIHRIARNDYTQAQLDAWAPAVFDQALWIDKIRAIRPYVVELAGRIVAYADVQPNGCIDHFFVSGDHARKGAGALLMNHIIGLADRSGTGTLTSHVSLTAQPFFAKFGFDVVEARTNVIRGVMVPNALMELRLGERLN